MILRVPADCHNNNINMTLKVLRLWEKNNNGNKGVSRFSKQISIHGINSDSRMSQQTNDSGINRVSRL